MPLGAAETPDPIYHDPPLGLGHEHGDDAVDVSPSFGALRDSHWETGASGWLGGTWPEREVESVRVHGATGYLSWRSAPRHAKRTHHGSFMGAIGRGLLEALKIATLGNQWGVEGRGHYLQGKGGDPWFGAGIGLIASAVMPDGVPAYLPRFGASLGFLVPEVGVLTNARGDAAFHGRLMMPVSVPLSSSLAIDLRMTVLGVTVGSEALPERYFGFALGLSYRGGDVL